MQPGTRVTWEVAGHFSNSGMVVELVGSNITTPPEGFVWVCWDKVSRVSLVQIKNLVKENGCNILDWFECLEGSGCYFAKANGFMAHVQPYDHQWLWIWNTHKQIADTLEEAKQQVEETVGRSL